MVFQTNILNFLLLIILISLPKKLIFLSNTEISKKLFFDFFVVDLNNLFLRKVQLIFFFEFDWITLIYTKIFYRNVKYSLNSSGIVTFLYSNDMHTHGTKDNCLSFEQWSEDFFPINLKFGFNNQVIELERVDKYEFVICHCWNSLEENDLNLFI